MRTDGQPYDVAATAVSGNDGEYRLTLMIDGAPVDHERTRRTYVYAEDAFLNAKLLVREWVKKKGKL